MKGIRIALVAVLVVLTVAGCRTSHRDGGAAKGRFVSAADQICTTHLRAIVGWLVQTRRGDSWQQASKTNAGIYQILSTTIARLDSLGAAPGPDSRAFDGYVGSLRARASLYMLLRIADDHHDGGTALGFQRRINQIDALGDRRAHRYGLRICGTGNGDVAKAFSAAGWR
jgi:hypothetical protein